MAWTSREGNCFAVTIGDPYDTAEAAQAACAADPNCFAYSQHDEAGGTKYKLKQGCCTKTPKPSWCKDNCDIPYAEQEDLAFGNGRTCNLTQNVAKTWFKPYAAPAAPAPDVPATADASPTCGIESGWLHATYTDAGPGTSLDDCIARHGDAHPDAWLWGHRNATHSDSTLQNTCFVYTDVPSSTVERHSNIVGAYDDATHGDDGVHYMRCADSDRCLKDGLCGKLFSTTTNASVTLPDDIADHRILLADNATSDVKTMPVETALDIVGTPLMTALTMERTATNATLHAMNQKLKSMEDVQATITADVAVCVRNNKKYAAQITQQPGQYLSWEKGQTNQKNIWRQGHNPLHLKFEER